MLLQHDAKVYLAARSTNKAEEAIRTLKAATGKEAIFLQLDLSDLASVKRSAEEFLSKEHDLHILFNNAYVFCIAVTRKLRANKLVTQGCGGATDKLAHQARV